MDLKEAINEMRKVNKAWSKVLMVEGIILIVFAAMCLINLIGG